MIYIYNTYIYIYIYTYKSVEHMEHEFPQNSCCVVKNSMSYNLLSNTCGLLANMGYENYMSHDVPHPQLPWDGKQWDEAFDPTSQGVPLRSHETQHEALLGLMVQKSGEKTTWDVKFPVNNEINYQSQLVSRISCINSRSSVSSPILGGSSQLSLFWNLNLPFELAFSLPGFLDLWY